MGEEPGGVRIARWGDGDGPLLHRLLGDPAMMIHLGGPESAEKIAERQVRYARMADPAAGLMFKIIDEETGAGVGSVGYWEREWRGETCYEMGWSVLTAAQGRGIAGRATALAIVAAREAGKHRFVHAFSGIDNPPSNALCRKLGFALLGDHEFEYPPGRLMRCNDWRLDLHQG